MLIIPCMTSTTLPPPTQFFVSQCMIHHFSQFFKPIIADHPMHDGPHNFGPSDPKFWQQVCNTICHNLRGDIHSQLCQQLLKQKIIRGPLNFGPIDPKFWEQVFNTICHVLRGDTLSQLCQQLQKQKIGCGPHNFGLIDPKFWEQVFNTICHNLRGEHHSQLCQQLQKQKNWPRTEQFSSN